MESFVCLKDFITVNSSLDAGNFYCWTDNLDCIWAGHALRLEGNCVCADLCILNYQTALSFSHFVIGRWCGPRLIALFNENLCAVHVLIVQLYVNSRWFRIKVLIKGQWLSLQVSHRRFIFFQISIFLWHLYWESAWFL